MIVEHFEVVVLGATPGGICAAVAAARLGSRVLLIERTAHIGGLPANGLGATDIATRGATGGLFSEFVGRIKKAYIAKYGTDAQQVRDCSDGFHFEPHVAEAVFEQMVSEQKSITLWRNRQFDALPAHIRKTGDDRLTTITLTNRGTGASEMVDGVVFIDATYEGDLAHAAGCKWETRREGKKEFGEPCAGRVYRPWGTGPIGDGSTGEGDDTIQAYNYRLCLTDDPENRVSVDRPATYNRADYASLIGDVKSGQMPSFMPSRAKDCGQTGVVNPVKVPNHKTDCNNHHRAFVSTDLPEENWQYPKQNWEWRDKFAKRLRDYTLGLVWFCQNDDELPETFRAEAKKWGLARDEYGDNGHFPRQMYVREGRRIRGATLFTALDAMAEEDVPFAYDILAGKRPPTTNNRAPIKNDSITASHYAIDSHAIRKREPGRVHLDGFLGLAIITKPYQVPFGVMVPEKVDGLLTPVPVSATHMGFGTLRMEPCWMAMGHAAGVAAHQAIAENVTPRHIHLPALQTALLAQKAVLIYLRDVPQTHPHYAALQKAGCLGFFPELDACPSDAIDAATARAWAQKAGVAAPTVTPGMTRAEYCALLFP